ncbi:unnamed protein product [Spodoptera exigua]|nr:unnamed protein product [Spodoptera exigua]
MDGRYTVVGHGTLNRATGINQDAHWQLTVMSNIDGAFHVCDNEDLCKALHIPYTQKIHVDEIFFPNRRNILGGIHLSVTKHESVSFRAAASSPEKRPLLNSGHLRTDDESDETEIEQLGVSPHYDLLDLSSDVDVEGFHSIFPFGPILGYVLNFGPGQSYPPNFRHHCAPPRLLRTANFSPALWCPL